MPTKILVADDSRYTRESVMNFVSTILKDIEIIPASDGQEAIEAIGNFGNELALVITDFQMPKVYGDEVAKKAISLNIPVIMMSTAISRVDESVTNKCVAALDKATLFEELKPLLIAIFHKP